MNHTDVILEVSNKTNVGVEDCKSIVKIFEKYVERNVFKSTKKQYDEIAISISETTGIEIETCKLVLDNLNDTFGQGLKDKLTFVIDHLMHLTKTSYQFHLKYCKTIRFSCFFLIFRLVSLVN